MGAVLVARGGQFLVAFDNTVARSYGDHPHRSRLRERQEFLIGARPPCPVEVLTDSRYSILFSEFLLEDVAACLDQKMHAVSPDSIQFADLARVGRLAHLALHSRT